MVESSVPAVLRERANLAPNDVAMTFYDYDDSWEGVEKTLTWGQLYRQMMNAADHFRQTSAPGDRALILAPQSLEYIVAYLGALCAGIIPVPLSVPFGGVHDERTLSVLADATPTLLLTTSSVIEHVAPFGEPAPGRDAPAIVQMDLLDLTARPSSSSRPGARQSATAGGDDSTPLYLQYTSGSTRMPAGVMVSNQNVMANFEQIMTGLFGVSGKVCPPGTTVVSWLPFYHDLGFMFGINFPILAGVPAKLMSPMGFLQRPARWMQLLANNTKPFSGAPNFAFDLAARKTTDEDMEGLDLGGILQILNGGERAQPATFKRFADRFARFNLDPSVLRQSYGMAEAVIYVATHAKGGPPKIGYFDSDKLPSGQAVDCPEGTGTALVAYDVSELQTYRIVDPETCVECPERTVGELWLRGRNVGLGYWKQPEATEATFNGHIVNPTEGTPEGPWLRTGDSSFVADGDVYIMGRVKDLLIVYGRNHSADDIEATIGEVIFGRAAAIAVSDSGNENVVALIEYRPKAGAEGDPVEAMRAAKRDVVSAVSKAHGLKINEVVLVAPGSLPITTSGKIRRARCVELYRQNELARLEG